MLSATMPSVTIEPMDTHSIKYLLFLLGTHRTNALSGLIEILCLSQFLSYLLKPTENFNRQRIIKYRNCNDFTLNVTLGTLEGKLGRVDE